MKVVGIDPSLTHTGLATAEACEVFKPKSTGMKRLHDIRMAILEHVWPAPDAGGRVDLVVIEGYSYGSRNSHAHSLGELGGAVRYMLWGLDIPYADVPPTVLKKFATGKGNAGKDQVVAAAARLGCPADDNNAVDAWWLRQMGLFVYQADSLTPTAYRNEAVSRVEWPHNV